MAAIRNGYDPELQMFVEKPREVDFARLRFVRWLVEQGRLEHGTMGHPDGEFAGYLEQECPTAA